MDRIIYRPRHKRVAGGLLTVTSVASVVLVALGTAMIVTLSVTGGPAVQDAMQVPAAIPSSSAGKPVDLKPPPLPGLPEIAVAEGVAVPPLPKPPARHTAPAVVAAISHPAATHSEQATPAPPPPSSPPPPPSSPPPPPPPPTSTPSQAGSSLGAQLLAKAETQQGTPYVYGGAAPGGFDCSGLVVWAAGQLGIPLPRTTEEMYSGSAHLVIVSSPQPGDIGMFGTGHDELYVKPGVFFGASHSGTVVGFHDYGPYYVPTEYLRLV